jgi:hypothetical protein
MRSSSLNLQQFLYLPLLKNVSIKITPPCILIGKAVIILSVSLHHLSKQILQIQVTIATLIFLPVFSFGTSVLLSIYSIRKWNLSPRFLLLTAMASTTGYRIDLENNKAWRERRKKVHVI